MNIAKSTQQRREVEYEYMYTRYAAIAYMYRVVVLVQEEDLEAAP